MAKILTFQPELKKHFKSLNLEWVEHYFFVEDFDRKQLDHPESIIASGGEILFLEHEGQIVGCCGLYHHGDKRFELIKMAVAPQYRGFGFGHILMNAAIDWIRNKDAKEFFLVSNTKLESAIALYKKHDFIEIQSVDHPHYKRCNITMRWQPKK